MRGSGKSAQLLCLLANIYKSAQILHVQKPIVMDRSSHHKKTKTVEPEQYFLEHKRRVESSARFHEAEQNYLKTVDYAKKLEFVLQEEHRKAKQRVEEAKEIWEEARHLLPKNSFVAARPNTYDQRYEEDWRHTRPLHEQSWRWNEYSQKKDKF